MVADTYTPNLHLTKVAGDARNWTERMNGNLTLIDAVVSAYFLIQNLQGVWTNSTTYTEGMTVVDAITATVYSCLIAHTTSPVPATFADDRAAVPSRWGVYSSPARSRGVWLPNTQYALNDFVTSGAKYAICVQTHTSGSNFDTDQVAGKWSVLVDLSNISASQMPIPGGAADANKFAVVNTVGNGYTIISALQALGFLGVTSIGLSLFTTTSQAAALNAIGGQAAGSYQPLNSYLTALAHLTTAPSCFQYFDSGSAPQLSVISADALSLLACANLAAMKSFLGIATDITTAQNTKNAIRDFGCIGDDGTDNAIAYGAIETFLLITGGKVFFPHGVYRSSVVLLLSANGSGIEGIGPGTCAYLQNTGPTAGTYGTVLRRTSATGNTVEVFRGTSHVRISKMAFWPVPFCTAGTEVVDAGTYTVVEDVSFQYGYNAHLFAAGSNGSVIKQSRAFAMFGPSPYKAFGSSNTISDWAQGLTYNNCFYYNPYPGAVEPTVGKVLAAWATGQTVVLGHVTVANGWIWTAKNGGTTAAAGAGPITTGLFTYAGNPTSAEFNDNGVKWQPVCREFQAALNLDGSVVVVEISDCEFLTSFYGIWVHNSDAGTTTPPQSLDITNTLTDHTISDGMRIDYGYEINIGLSDFRLSASGRGITFVNTFLGGFRYIGGQVLDNALDGIEINGVGNIRAIIMGVTFARNGLKTNNTYRHLSHPAAVTGVTCGRCIFGDDGVLGNDVAYDVEIGAGADNYSYTDNIMKAGATGSILNAPGTAASRIVEKNVIY